MRRWSLITRATLDAEAHRELSELLPEDTAVEQREALLKRVSLHHLKAQLAEGPWLELLCERLQLLALKTLPERPLPHFIEELTPERAPHLAPLAERLRTCEAQLTAGSAGGEVLLERALTQGFKEIGAFGLLLLLGQRRTSASFSSALGLPPSHKVLCRSFELEHTPGKVISVGGRAFTKHAARTEDPWWDEGEG